MHTLTCSELACIAEAYTIINGNAVCHRHYMLEKCHCPKGMKHHANNCLDKPGEEQ